MFNTRYYVAAQRYEISLQVLKNITQAISLDMITMSNAIHGFLPIPYIFYRWTFSRPNLYLLYKIMYILFAFSTTLKWSQGDRNVVFCHQRWFVNTRRTSMCFKVKSKIDFPILLQVLLLYHWTTGGLYKHGELQLKICRPMTLQSEINVHIFEVWVVDEKEKWSSWLIAIDHFQILTAGMDLARNGG